MAKKVIVGGRIESKEVGGIVTGAAEILDDTKGKKQSVINQETDAELERLDGAKQDVLTFDNTPTEGSNNPVKSGGVYAADKALSDAIEAILLLIPSAASALNKLVDQATMNSSISTATATFRGTYNVVTDLELAVDATHEQIAAKLAQVVSEADNNDYAFVQVPVSAESTDIRRTERYKFNGTAWAYEYDLNTSGFTAAQWAAINSGITLALVGKLIGLPTSSELMALLGQKQDTLTFDNIPTSGSANPVKSGGVYSAINDEKTAREQLAQSVTGINGRLGNVEEVIPSGAAANNKLVANNSMEAYVASIIQNITASFTIATADGHINLTLTQTNGRVASLTLTSSDIASAQALTALTGRVSTAEGNITSLGGRVSTNETDIANLQQLYNNLQQSKPVPVTALPSTGQQQGVIYRLAGTTSYYDYMWNGSTWVLMATYNNAIDQRPKKASLNLVTSGGVFDNMGALDVSELNATENPHTLAQYVDLSAALAAIPTDYQKGGMNIKFVQSSDNKYVQARCMAQNFTTNVTQWQWVESEPKFNSHNVVESGGLYERTHLVDISKQRTKNLFNPAWYNNRVSIDDDGWFFCTNEDMYYIGSTFAGESETQYTFSVVVKGGSIGSGRISFNYTDSTRSRIILSATTVDTVVFLTSEAGKTIESITFDFAGSSADRVNLNYFKDVQLEKGAYRTEYIPYYLLKDILLDKKFDGYNFAISPYSYDSWKNFAPRDLFSVENIRLNKNGGYEEANSGYNTTPYIFVPKGRTIYLRLICENPNVSSLFKYDLDKNPVTSIYSGVIDVTSTYTTTEDCYLRACQGKTTINNPSYIHLIKEDNVQNRLDAVQNALPDYWNDYLKTKEGEIASLVANTGNHGDLFIYFSDYHINRNTNPCRTPRIIHNLFNKLGRLKVFCGGDLISQESTRLAAMELMQQYMEDFKDIDLYNVFGNHDGNDYGTDDVKLTIDYHYPILFKYLENNPHVTTTGKDYYYLDYDFHKIRYIFLNTYDNGYNLSIAEHVEQINWFINVLNSVEDGWYVVVLPHIFYEIDTTGDTPSLYRQSGILIGAITDAYQLKQASSCTYEGGTVSFDFTNAHGKVAAIITGHVHYDYIEQTAAGYPIITIEQDAIGYPGVMPQPTRTLGTYTEQAFDIMSIDLVGKTIKTVRIGSGENRTCTFV